MKALSHPAYIMEDPREASRLERKVDPDSWVAKYMDRYLFPQADVLSVGCGPAIILRSICEFHPDVTGTGLDISPLRVRQATERNQHSSRSRFFCGDVREMPFASDTFDIVYTRMLLQYIGEKERAVNEMVRVCKPGGTVLMQDLDGQLIWHYPEDPDMQEAIERVLKGLAESGFDPFAGRKLYWLASKAGLKNIHVQAECYHLIAGEVDPTVFEQWELKLEIFRPRLEQVIGSKSLADEQIQRFLSYLRRPDTMTYSNVFTVTGEKQL
jgi:ubiquinone/menaquinone biosynthesis C-methylase UbiE